MSTDTGQDPATGSEPAGPHPVAPDVTEGSGPPPESTGIIKNYLGEKGFGFIAQRGEADVFFHVNNLADPDPAMPVEIGQRVRFVLEPSQQKPGTFVAVNIHRIGASETGAEGQGHA